MYESHHQSDHAIAKNPLTEIDYQLMMDVNAYTKYNPSMVEHNNHPEYLALMQAQSNHLNPSMTDNPYYQDEFDFGSDSNNSSNESLYLRNMDHQSSIAAHLTTSSLNLPFSNSATDSPQFSTGQILSSAPTVSSSNQQYIQCSANPYIVYQQSFTNTSDPVVYPSLEENVSSYYGTKSSNNNISNAANNHGDPFYAGELDEQQQFFFMQQQQQKNWSQQQQQQQQPQQQQVIGYSYNQPSLTSPSSYFSTAYTTDNDTRSQIYVRKACVSCKQSHVACDVQRPCSRCVRLNKTETCVDAQRKKRGRPCGSGKKKKEEESEFIRRQQQYF